MSRTHDTTRRPCDTSVWETLTNLVEAATGPAGEAARSRAVHEIERVGWDLITAEVGRGALTHAEACRVFTHLQRLMDSTNWVDLATAFRSEAKKDGHQPLAVRVSQYLEVHFAEPITQNSIAHVVGESVRRVRREFHEYHGLNAHEYLTQLRVTGAMRLLAETDLKVEAIAREVGFRNKSTLYRCLRKRRGATPGAIRRGRSRDAADGR